MTKSHGVPPRGLTHAPRTKGFSGAFGRMFPELRAATFGATDDENIVNLSLLGKAMSSEADPADPRDGFDDEESGIPALYTYFGQFVDHDLTFDPASSLQKQADPDALTDYRTPSFDLDNVYGRGPDDQPYLYNADGLTMLLGDSLAGATSGAHDLPRASNGRALIGDPRNDENSIVSQLQGLFHRFHNRLQSSFPALTFAQVQDEVRLHYQYIVLNDFLPRIVSKTVLDALRSPDGKWDPTKLRFFDPSGASVFMPVEFAVAAYRLGHSMVRPGYRLNDADATLQPIFPPSPTEPNPHNFIGLTGFKPMVQGWGIDWGRLIDVNIRTSGDDKSTDAIKKQRLQFAYRIDTSLVNPLATLPTSVAKDPPPSLGARNLIRAWRLGLPSGQAVAHRMGVTPLTDSQILIGKGVDRPDAPLPSIDTIAGNAFKGKCPLWTYVLAEAMRHQTLVEIPVSEKKMITTPQLGPVGGRIVAEVFLGLANADKASLLHYPSWTPMKAGFRLKDLVAYALGL